MQNMKPLDYATLTYSNIYLYHTQIEAVLPVKGSS